MDPMKSQSITHVGSWTAQAFSFQPGNGFSLFWGGLSNLVGSDSWAPQLLLSSVSCLTRKGDEVDA